jgi:hypothetical protein
MPAVPKKRSTILVAVGAGVFVVGAGLATFATRDATHSDAKLSSAAKPAAAVGAVTPAAGSVATSSFTIPDGHQAIAVSVPFVAGLAGYAKAGDLVNVYGAYKAIPVGPEDPVAKLALSKVKVLAVTPGVAGSDSTYVLAVSTTDAEAIVYLTNFQKVWLTLARDDQTSLVPKGFSDGNV